ncbi:MAG: hypothetical protein B6D39_01445 [Anaerolineae bacterium UTCFX2]|jgi:hypothetical protein|nr:hypothetical protein [Anaerolineales bacterium]OQY94490.1 MAG: hypothetical protein B6D39_01445 [Anaerolineae bacterium UTCFX2]
MKNILWLIKTHAILLLAGGIAFGLYGPLMMAFFAVPELLQISTDIYWQIAAFARMFGAALFGFGLLLWALRNAFIELSPPSQRGVLAALILANLMGGFISITQQSSIWGTPAGWITTAIFAVFTIAYILAILRLPSKQLAENSPETTESIHS